MKTNIDNYEVDNDFTIKGHSLLPDRGRLKQQNFNRHGPGLIFNFNWPGGGQIPSTLFSPFKFLNMSNTDASKGITVYADSVTKYSRTPV